MCLGKMRKIIAGLTGMVIFFSFNMSIAETTSSQMGTAAVRLIELGYLAEDYSAESFAAAVRDFRKGNNLPEGDTIDEPMQNVLMSVNARTQQEYISSKAQAMREQSSLSQGAYGEAVTQLQTSLSLYGYYPEICTGVFDEETEKAVCRFQLACGLNVTGIADRTMFLRLYEGETPSYDDFIKDLACKQNDSGENVHAIQIWLRKIGIKGFASSGNYGSLTTNAVKRFQESVELEITGAADEETVRMLIEKVLSIRKTTIAAASDTTSEEITALLQAAGFESETDSDEQVELYLMKYQKTHGLSVTGIADRETVDALRNGILPVSGDEIVETDRSAMADYAYAMIGGKCDLLSSYGFPEYVYLKCGRALPSESSVQNEQLSSIKDASRGDVLKATGIDGAVWGIYFGNGGMVCTSGGLVLLCYPDEGCEICRLVV